MEDNYINRKLDGSGFVLTDGDRIIVDAPNIPELVDGIIENGLEKSVPLVIPQQDSSFVESGPEDLTVEEHEEFWDVYSKRILNYTTVK